MQKHFMLFMLISRGVSAATKNTQETTHRKQERNIRSSLKEWQQLMEDSEINSRIGARSDWLVSTVPFRPRVRGQHVYTSRSTGDEA